MPQRPFARDQVFLLPPRLDEWIAPDHPVRFVAAWLDDLPPETWAAMGISLSPAARGEARYAPQALLAIWLHGFMTGIRSTRALEIACRDQLPFRWLSGNQTPDHNTLSRFYRTHRAHFHELFQASIRHAVEADVLDWGLQAVDGTKVWADASGDRMLTGPVLDHLAARVEAELARIDAGIAPADVAPPEPAPADTPPAGSTTARHVNRGPARLPRRRRDLAAMRDRVRRAQGRIAEDRAKGNLTDPDAHQMTAHGVNRPGYNAQAVVRAVRTTQGRGRLIVALAVRTRADDHAILPDLLLQATARTGQAAAVTVADRGYHSGEVVAACADLGCATVISPSPIPASTPYGPEAFVVDPRTGVMTCPEGATLTRWKSTHPIEVRYGARKASCQPCRAKAVCCPTAKRGRVVVRTVYADVVTRQRAQVARDDGVAIRRRRKGLIEGVFGTLKTCHGGRRMLLRGLANVDAEWTLLATAFNLRTLSRLGVVGPQRTSPDRRRSASRVPGVIRLGPSPIVSPPKTS